MSGPVNIDTFSTLVESVYESAVDPDHWSQFLKGLAQALNAKSGMFRVIDERLPAVRANVHYNLDPELQEAHAAYYVTRDVFIDALRDRPETYIAPGDAIIPYKALQRTEFFADYCQPQDTYHVCGGLAMRNEEFTIKFGLQRDRNTGPFSWDDAAFIQRFVPHIRRAARLEHLLETARLNAASAEHALESLDVGVILLDEHGGVLHTNTKAESLLRGRRTLTTASGTLTAVQAVDAQGLRHLLRIVGNRAQQHTAPIPEAMLLTRLPDEPQLMLVAVPIAGQQRFQGPWPRTSVAVFVSNLADAGLLNHKVLTALYGLTEAEAKLAGALSQGRELGEISRSWHVSRETLRTHLKRVLGKTGTSRQAELVRLLTGKPWNLMEVPPSDGTEPYPPKQAAS